MTLFIMNFTVLQQKEKEKELKSHVAEFRTFVSELSSIIGSDVVSIELAHLDIRISVPSMSDCVMSHH